MRAGAAGQQSKPFGLSDAAIAAGLPYRKVYDLALEGHLGPVERRGGRLFVTREGVRAFIRDRDRRIGPGAGRPSGARSEMPA